MDKEKITAGAAMLMLTIGLLCLLVGAFMVNAARDYEKHYKEMKVECIRRGYAKYRMNIETGEPEFYWVEKGE